MPGLEAGHQHQRAGQHHRGRQRRQAEAQGEAHRHLRRVGVEDVAVPEHGTIGTVEHEEVEVEEY